MMKRSFLSGNTGVTPFSYIIVYKLIKYKLIGGFRQGAEAKGGMNNGTI